MNDFKIQPYTKKELALFYFPTADPHVAVNRLMSWVNRCKPLQAIRRHPNGSRHAR